MAKAATVKKIILGKIELRLVKNEGLFHGLADGRPIVQGDDSDDVWRRLLAEAGKANPRYFGFHGARARFLHFFPTGFSSVDYETRERAYKIEAKATLDQTVPLR